MAITKPTTNGAGVAVPAEYSDPEFKAQYPTLYEYLAHTKYADGSARQTATILVFVEGGLCKVCLNDRDLRRQAFISSRNVNEALSLLDDQLRDEEVDWRPVRQNKRV